MATRIFDVNSFDGMYYNSEDINYIGITDGKNQCYINAEHKELLMSQLQSETITIPNINKATKSMREIFKYFSDLCMLTLTVDEDIISFCMDEAKIKSKKQFFNEIKSDIEKFDLDDVIELSDDDFTLYEDFREKFSFKY